MLKAKTRHRLAVGARVASYGRKPAHVSRGFGKSRRCAAENVTPDYFDSYLSKWDIIELSLEPPRLIVPSEPETHDYPGVDAVWSELSACYSIEYDYDRLFDVYVDIDVNKVFEDYYYDEDVCEGLMSGDSETVLDFICIEAALVGIVEDVELTCRYDRSNPYSLEPGLAEYREAVEENDIIDFFPTVRDRSISLHFEV